jgi:hypothetical protein
VACASSGFAAWLNLAPVGQEAAQALEIFIIYFPNLVYAELADFAARRKTLFAARSARSARPTGATGTSSITTATKAATATGLTAFGRAFAIFGSCTWATRSEARTRRAIKRTGRTSLWLLLCRSGSRSRRFGLVILIFVFGCHLILNSFGIFNTGRTFLSSGIRHR